jgi:hypothetical protein
MPLQDGAGNIPVGFPVTMGDFYSMAGADINALLVAYGLQPDGSEQQQKLRLWEYIRGQYWTDM